ncbi:MAG: four helix bundle protein [Alphaproteobacteria bacterium]|nr:four helix bundle protein [Alphaproteobacteria bacterium]
MTIKSYKDLDVWNKSVELVATIYTLTKTFPKDELYSLTSQMRRAAISIPSNIAEGRAKPTTRDFMRFLSIAIGSAAELETQLIIAERLGYLSQDRLHTLSENVNHIERMLHKLHLGLNKRLNHASSAV